MAAPDELPRDLRRLVSPRPSGACYSVIRLTPEAVALVLAHPRAMDVVEAMRECGRISERLADQLTALIEDRR